MPTARISAAVAMTWLVLSSSSAVAEVAHTSSALTVEQSASNASESDPKSVTDSQTGAIDPLSVTATSTVSDATVTTTMNAIWQSNTSGSVDLDLIYFSSGGNITFNSSFAGSGLTMTFDAPSAGQLELLYSGHTVGTVNSTTYPPQDSGINVRINGSNNGLGTALPPGTQSFSALELASGTNTVEFYFTGFSGNLGGNSSSLTYESEIHWTITPLPAVPVLTTPGFVSLFATVTASAGLLLKRA